MRFSCACLAAALGLACGVETRELAGKLGPEDPVLTLEGSYYEAHEVALGPGWSLEATMRSTELDALLVLVDPEGALVAEADGGAGGHDARLRATVTTGGRYRVLATSFHGREEGAYALRITTRAGPAEAPGAAR